MDTTYTKNRAALVEYFSSSANPDTKRIGLELEHFLLHLDGTPVSYSEKFGVKDFLTELAEHFENLYYVDGQLMGMYNDDYSITLEPSAQLEISVMPRCRISQIEEIYDSFSALLSPYLSKYGFSLVNFGYHPTGRVSELELIPKKRYEYMDAYFKKSGSHGINMMRGTASTQISIDYEDEKDFVKKYRLAYLLGPAFKYICDNTPVYEGKENHTPLKRTYIWRNTDKARCSPPPDLFSKNFGFSSYAEYLLGVAPIFIFKDGKAIYTGKKTAASLYSDLLMSKADITHLLSMVFPDVRLKGYIEIRGADSLPKKATLGYAALVKAILYSPEVVEGYLDKYPITLDDITAAEDALSEHGLSASIYGVGAKTFIDGIFCDAKEHLQDDERYNLEYLIEHFKACNEKDI